jgi:hypothetical protein
MLACVVKDTIIFSFFQKGRREMFKSKWVLFLVLLLVVLVGLTVITLAVDPGGLSLALGVTPMGHACGSTCPI